MGESVGPSLAVIEPGIAAEFPELSMTYIRVDVRHASSRQIAKRLKLLAERIGGAQAVRLREQPIPHAYRTFFRHIGIEPDQIRTPIEEVVVRRLMTGGLAKTWPVEDALTLAVADTGVAVWAYDGSAVRGGLSLRLAGEGEQIDREPVSAGTILVTDEKEPLSILFGRFSDRSKATPNSDSVTVCGLRVAGVSQLEIDEALSIFQGAFGQ